MTDYREDMAVAHARDTGLKRTPLKRTAGPKRKTALKKGRGFAASPAQRKKVEALPCIVCGRYASEYLAVDPAHVCARSLGGCDLPDCVVPLCRDQNGGHHRDYDEGHLDLLPYLEPRWRAEQAHAVMHLGLEQTRVRTCPSQYRQEAA